MKFLVTCLLLLTASIVIAQSPAYNIVLELRDTINPYSIEMKFCRPKQQTGFKDWFAHDTSKIKWEKLVLSDFTCGEYFTGETFNKAGKNRFKTANQGMVWENVLVFKITGKAATGKPMYIIVPIFIQSFVTSVTIKNVPFKPGIYELDDLQTTISGMRITMQADSAQIWNDHTGKKKYKLSLEH